MRAALCLALALPTAAFLVPAPRVPAVRMAAADEAKAFCIALQNGQSTDGLTEFVFTRAGARSFFSSYLKEDEVTCADAEAPPSALVDSLEQAPPEVVEIMLMNVAISAATAVGHGRAGRDEAQTASKRECARASVLVKAMWERSPILQRSCGALEGAVAAELGESVTEYDGASGDIELLRIQWSGLLGVCNYDAEQLEAVQEALALCPPRKE